MSTSTGFRHPGLSLAGSPLPLLDRARVYVCGITPYDVTHLGHAATFVWADVLTRVLRDVGVRPETCRNVTDVDDVLTAAAARAGDYYDRFAYRQQYDFDRDMAALRVRRPDHEPRARHHIHHVVALGQGLLAREAAYLRGGSVYFRGADAAESSGLGMDKALALAKEFDEPLDHPDKDHPLDVVVWQASDKGDPAWDSPWGPGRPGWHAECTAMALTTFGPALDIHAGGKDLLFPHHTYESALAETFTGVTPFSRRWMHVGVVGVDGQKMAKSAGNLVLVDDLLRDHPPAVIRLMLLDRPWDQDWDYSPAALHVAAGRLDKLYTSASRPGSNPAADIRLIESLMEDLDVPAALDIAEHEGGATARHLIDTLALG